MLYCQICRELLCSPHMHKARLLPFIPCPAGRTHGAPRPFVLSQLGHLGASAHSHLTLL